MHASWDGKPTPPLAPNYFHKDRADTGDTLLISLKFRGLVPQNCLLSGIAAAESLDEGKTPCDTCLGPRHKCGGTPRKE